MMRRTSLITALAVFAAACSGGAGGALNELMDQVRLDDPLSGRTYAENRELIEVPESVPTLTDYLANDPSESVLMSQEDPNGCGTRSTTTHSPTTKMFSA